MIINKAFKVRIYPNKIQQEQINKTLGSCRFLFNQMLAERMKVYEELKNDKRKLYEYKYKTEKEYKQEFKWMNEVDSVSLQQSRINLSNAYSNFFKSLKGKRKGESGFPKFKKKKNKNSYRTVVTNDNIKVNFENKKVKLPKLDWINFKDKRNNFQGIIKSATVSRTCVGKYFVSILFEQEIETKDLIINQILKDKVVGLDMSLDKFFVDNNGNSPAYEKLYRESEKKLKKLQRKVSKKKLGSKNWYKAVKKVNLVHEIISNKRKDFTHKLSNKLVKENDIIVVESLSIKGMSQALKLGKSVTDLGYSEFIRQLNYKATWNSKLVIQADKWFASSKLCSICGYKKSDLELSDREWICPNCGENHNRDENAGKNLKKFGLNILGLEQPDFKPVETKIADFQVIENKSFVNETGILSL